MPRVRTRVENGRLVLDEPTDLPEGAELELAPVDDQPWDLTPEQHAELKARIAAQTGENSCRLPRSSLACARIDPPCAVPSILVPSRTPLPPPADAAHRA